MSTSVSTTHGLPFDPEAAKAVRREREARKREEFCRQRDEALARERAERERRAQHRQQHQAAVEAERKARAERQRRKQQHQEAVAAERKRGEIEQCYAEYLEADTPGPAQFFKGN